MWFDPDILRINYDGHGRSLGTFGGEERILVIMKTGEYYTTTTDATNHYDDGILRIEKYVENKVWTAIVDDADQGFYYIKRFTLDDNAKRQSLIGGNAQSKLIALSDESYSRFEVLFGGADSFRESLTIDAEEYIAVKSAKAKGKRLSNYEVEMVRELAPREMPEEEEQSTTIAEIDNESVDTITDAEHSVGESQEAVFDRLTGQQRLFDDDDL